MKVLGVTAIGLMAGIAAGVFGLTPFVGSRMAADSMMHRVVTQQPATPTAGPDSVSDQASIPAGADVTEPVVEVVARKPSNPWDQPGGVTAESNLRYKLELLEKGIESLQTVADYTAKMQKRELVRGELLAEQTIVIKCRHKPFSVYMLWLAGEVGREVIYVEGANDGNLIAHDGGWKARIPAFSLPPEGSLAMVDTRYPVTSAGLIGLARVMAEVHRDDLNRSNVANCEIDERQQFEGRPCCLFTTKYKSAGDSPVYRKSVTWIDREWNVPVHSRHFEWPASATESPVEENELDEATLLESYSFTDVKLRCDLTDHDFDRTNPEYRFR